MTTLNEKISQLYIFFHLLVCLKQTPSVLGDEVLVVFDQAGIPLLGFS